MRSWRLGATVRIGLIALAMQAVVMGAASSARAGPFIDFNAVQLPGSANSISWAGGSQPLVGQALTFFSVTGESTPLHAGVPITFIAVPLQLNFSTGSYLGNISTSWRFDSGGSLSLFGSVPGVVPSADTIYSGTFSGEATISTIPNSTMKVFSAAMVGSLNAALATYFGLSTTDTYGGAITLQFASGATPGNPISGATFNSGDVAIAPMPEPAGLTLFGLGVAALAVSCQLRRMRRA
jgi:hypothetical protein